MSWRRISLEAQLVRRRLLRRVLDHLEDRSLDGELAVNRPLVDAHLAVEAVTSGEGFGAGLDPCSESLVSDRSADRCGRGRNGHR